MMTTTTTVAETPTSLSGSKPYKGPESYQVEDAHLFYGRDREAEQLIAKILSSRFTLVHAQSGAGKTSLLNARVIPGLEARGWGTFRVLPQNDPVMALRGTTLRYVLPPLDAELRVLERALSELTQPGADPTVEELLGLYDGLDARDARLRSLVAPVPAGGRESEPVVPLFARLLRSNIEAEALAEHLGAIWQYGAGADEPLPREQMPHVGPGTRVGELARLFLSARMAAGYKRLYGELDVPVSDLRAFFENLFEVYGGRRTRFALVLIFDQFEELFTRFIDLGPASAADGKDLPDWRLRKEFFDQFARLYGGGDGGDGGDGARPAAPRLPVRYVVSMRDEYIAQLDPLRPVVGPLDEVSFHLTLLERGQSESAIRGPAKQFGYNYSDDCYEEIVRQLTKEDRFVEPAHLQLVCEKLWKEQGARLAALSLGDAAGTEERQIPIATFENLGGTRGILNSFFRDFLDGLSVAERREALELLEPLVTTSGTRNIIERDQLVNAPFRDGARRADLLKRMADRTIVRTEPRLGGYFVEITHEFLIAPILEAIRDAFAGDIEYNHFRLALRTLERLNGAGIGSGMVRLLTASEFLMLHEHRSEVSWNSWGIEVMIRSAITTAADREHLRHWLDEYDSLEQPVDVASLIGDGGRDLHGQDLLSLAVLRLVNERRDALALTPYQLAHVLRSTLAAADDDELEHIRYWTRRTYEHAS